MNHRLQPIHSLLQVACLVLGCFVWQTAAAQTDVNACGPLANAFGPYDYRTERNRTGRLDPLFLVESTHFLPYIEAGIRGHSSTTAGGDLDYTLRAFPNHPRALVSMMRHAEKEKTPKPSGSRYTIECWFDRALRFQPDDTTVRMIFASYLSKNNRVPEATAQLERVEASAKDNAFTLHNIGLVYFDMKLYDKALAQAHKAMALGFEKQKLKELLEQSGHWKEPETAPALSVDAAADADADAAAAADPAAMPASAPASAN